MNFSLFLKYGSYISILQLKEDLKQFAMDVKKSLICYFHLNATLYETVPCQTGANL